MRKSLGFQTCSSSNTDRCYALQMTYQNRGFSSLIVLVVVAVIVVLGTAFYKKEAYRNKAEPVATNETCPQATVTLLPREAWFLEGGNKYQTLETSDSQILFEIADNGDSAIYTQFDLHGTGEVQKSSTFPIQENKYVMKDASVGWGAYAMVIIAANPCGSVAVERVFLDVLRGPQSGPMPDIGV